MSEMTMQVLLSEDQQELIKKSLHELLLNEINHFKDGLVSNEKYLKKKQICVYLNLSNNTVDRLIEAGMPRINIQGIILYPKEEIDEWLKKYQSNRK
ncbi:MULTISPECIES: helix-turn-helix domain-containing protein [Enterococcus]|uniref:helix-turn-helix domain-containing protein n=1 Tax=Enterococcus TaxID=1350 RepID=UPI00032D8AB2|nr:helix-turn-helix domain-containing protein [Enterococcus faecalis]EGO2576287.1 helix-turn-helix domain-containing protein [Enterococcus faecalis]EGO2648506.1 helix-turn-helix domain-containing protein [Enterococcus faecalis]EGO5066001.1 helix-turn-helix domain-containing protein [Enterococcus faecalis]EGO5075259.1 helix-turn-helix domain-containing protein [Enterococcus faecalis]EGO5973574.1 helix-turn-helix domain-containing protein [Enterococcus faecalis]